MNFAEDKWSLKMWGQPSCTECVNRCRLQTWFQTKQQVNGKILECSRYPMKRRALRGSKHKDLNYSFFKKYYDSILCFLYPVAWWLVFLHSENNYCSRFQNSCALFLEFSQFLSFIFALLFSDVVLTNLWVFFYVHFVNAPVKYHFNLILGIFLSFSLIS